jgi:Uncharacterized protein conserved in bacteria (DUF2169)
MAGGSVTNGDRQQALRDRRRLVVCQPEPPVVLGKAHLAVGALRWIADVPRLTVIAKAVLDVLDSGELAFAEPRLQLEQPWTDQPTLPDELRAASDFVPRKARTDVVFAGLTYAARPARTIAGSFAIEPATEPPAWRLKRDFAAAGLTESSSFPLTMHHLVADRGRTPEPVGPSRVRGSITEPGAGFDPGLYAVAPIAQQLPFDALGPLRLTMEGLVPAADPLTVVVPDYRVRVTLEASTWGRHELPMQLDTIAFDSEHRTIDLVWRGDVEVIQDGRELRRIIASIEPRGASRSDADRNAHLQRGTFEFAVEPEDLTPESPPIPSDHPRLTIARYASWRSKAPPPKLPLDVYVRVAAELSEGREPREDVLASYGIDDARWTVEERGWLEAMARDALQGDLRLSVLHAQLYAEASAELASATPSPTLDVYAEIRAAIEMGDDPGEKLAAHGLSVPRWIRIDAQMRDDASDDRGLRAEVDTRVAEHKERIRVRRVGASEGTLDAGPNDEGDEG